MELGSEEKVLAKYPELGRDDLVAVEAHIASSIRARTHDEITGRLRPMAALVGY